MNIQNKIRNEIIIILSLIVITCIICLISYNYSKDKLDTAINITLTFEDGTLLQRTIYATLTNINCTLSTEEQNRLMKILDKLNNKIDSKVDQNFKDKEK